VFLISNITTPPKKNTKSLYELKKGRKNDILK